MDKGATKMQPVHHHWLAEPWFVSIGERGKQDMKQLASQTKQGSNSKHCFYGGLKFANSLRVDIKENVTVEANW